MGISFFNTFIIHTILIITKKQSFLRIDLYLKCFPSGKVQLDSLMVPKDRIELSADPYQGSVLPLNYIGMYYILSYLFFYFNIKWCSRRESNPYHLRRRERFYPLNYSNNYFYYILFFCISQYNKRQVFLAFIF